MLDEGPPGAVAVTQMIRAASARPEILESPQKVSGGGQGADRFEEPEARRSLNLQEPTKAASATQELLTKMTDVLSKLADGTSSGTEAGTTKLWERHKDTSQEDLNLKCPDWRAGNSTSGSILMMALLNRETDTKHTFDALRLAGKAGQRMQQSGRTRREKTSYPLPPQVISSSVFRHL